MRIQHYNTELRLYLADTKRFRLRLELFLTRNETKKKSAIEKPGAKSLGTRLLKSALYVV